VTDAKNSNRNDTHRSGRIRITSRVAVVFPGLNGPSAGTSRACSKFRFNEITCSVARTAGPRIYVRRNLHRLRQQATGDRSRLQHVRNRGRRVRPTTLAARPFFEPDSAESLSGSVVESKSSQCPRNAVRSATRPPEELLAARLFDRGCWKMKRFRKEQCDMRASSHCATTNGKKAFYA
jgi:hypothetical protein